MGDKNEIRRMTVPISGVSKDGSFYGTVTKEMREEVDFEELFEDADEIKGKAEIVFTKEQVELENFFTDA